MKTQIEILKKQIDEMNQQISRSKDEVEIYFLRKSITNLIDKIIELT